MPGPTLDVAMPERLARRPRDRRGFPIPMTNWVDEDGTPDFTRITPELVANVTKHSLCALCGDRLEYRIAFVSGPIGVKNRTYTDPGMHIDCAEYAIQVCPFLAMPSTSYARRLKGPALHTPGLTLHKPPLVAMAIVRSYTVRGDIIKTARPIEVRFYPYESHGVWYNPTPEVFEGAVAESEAIMDELHKEQREIARRDRRRRMGLES